VGHTNSKAQWLNQLFSLTGSCQIWTLLQSCLGIFFFFFN